jgi:hypothetical protein
LSEVDKRQEALAPARESVDLYRELAAKAPDAYHPDLASALKNLAIFLSEVGQREAALAMAEEAVRTLAPQFLALPAAFDLSIASMCRTTRSDAGRSRPSPTWSYWLRSWRYCSGRGPVQAARKGRRMVDPMLDPLSSCQN